MRATISYFLKLRKKLRTGLLFVALFAFLISNALNGQTYQQVHDPSNPVNSGGKLWIFTTGAGIYRMSKSSLDPLSGWTSGSKVLPNTPSWLSYYVPGFSGDFWAPHLDGSRVYYSCSTFGSRVSAIGMASGSPGGSYSDQGYVLHSNNNTAYNAIDPFVFEGYLLFGSWSNGINISQLNSSGKLVNTNNIINIKNVSDAEAPAMTK